MADNLRLRVGVDCRPHAFARRCECERAQGARWCVPLVDVLTEIEAIRSIVEEIGGADCERRSVPGVRGASTPAAGRPWPPERLRRVG